MTDNTALGDRMKRYERTTRHLAPPRTYSLLRVDIRAAHAYLKNAERPFDARFMQDMDAVALALCEEITGSVLAYVQSDEISVLFHDFAGLNTQPWFGGVMAKQLSISAAYASVQLHELRGLHGLVMFDSRIWHMSDPVEVANYFVWRQRDAVRNSIQMVAQFHFPHSELQNLNGDQLQEKLWQEKKVNWSNLPDGCKRGRIIVRGTDPAGYAWVQKDAPHFTAQPDGFLAQIIPALPSFSV